ncbi:hypothetical protein [Exiguobacterium sp. s146]|uniref:hypothetical protein n=1 Tax=Exiguobacterium sp. s146 TaxID=2751223 RepID=UPI001BEC6D2E|nr:hypothetical protein [Exiguobacterium sp. s146]
MTFIWKFQTLAPSGNRVICTDHRSQWDFDIIDKHRLAEFIWFLLVFPSVGLVKIMTRTNTLLRFNSSAAYKRLVRLEGWTAIGLIGAYVVLMLTLLLNPEQISLLVLATGLSGIGIIASSRLDRSLGELDPEHVTHKVYAQGKVGFFPK